MSKCCLTPGKTTSPNHRLATASQDGVMVLLARLGQIFSRELYHLWTKIRTDRQNRKKDITKNGLLGWICAFHFELGRCLKLVQKSCLKGLKTLGWTVAIILEGEDFEDVDPDLASQSSWELWPWVSDMDKWWRCMSDVHPGRLIWNIIMEVWKIIFLSKWLISRFHVYLPGCKLHLP